MALASGLLISNWQHKGKTMQNENYDLLCDDDKPNVCPHDGTRTKLIALFPDSSLEQCPQCRKTFNFYDDYSEA